VTSQISRLPLFRTHCHTAEISDLAGEWIKGKERAAREIMPSPRPALPYRFDIRSVLGNPLSGLFCGMLEWSTYGWQSIRVVRQAFVRHSARNNIMTRIS